jgi:hypothetical protein
MKAEVLDCIHGTDLMQRCQACVDLADQMVKEYEMQTSGTFPQLTRKDSVTKPATKKGGGKKGGGKGC